MKDHECSWNTKSEEYRKNTARENALQGIVQELNFLEVAVEDVELIIKKIALAMLLDYGNNEKKRGQAYATFFIEIVSVQRVH
jgi:hypothetical protein